jgi:hypothetical protein
MGDGLAPAKSASRGPDFQWGHESVMKLSQTASSVTLHVKKNLHELLPNMSLRRQNLQPVQNQRAERLNVTKM